MVGVLFNSTNSRLTPLLTSSLTPSLPSLHYLARSELLRREDRALLQVAGLVHHLAGPRGAAGLRLLDQRGHRRYVYFLWWCGSCTLCRVVCCVACCAFCCVLLYFLVHSDLRCAAPELLSRVAPAYGSNLCDCLCYACVCVKRCTAFSNDFMIRAETRHRSAANYSVASPARQPKRFVRLSIIFI
jgi:hypothetical protein